jgi:2'-5' RNA ligase
VSQRYFDLLREQHFPPERNYLKAHLTMFHALPPDDIETLTTLLAGVTIRRQPIDAEVFGLRSLGHGVAFELPSPALQALRGEIASAFQDKLTAQDRQIWRPHITVQNKVSRERAHDLLIQIQQRFEPWTAVIEGVKLWRYEGGPWALIARFGLNGATRRSRVVE